MQFSWIVYAVSAYAIVAMANIIDKLLLDKHIKDSSIIVIFSGTAATLAGLAIMALHGIPHLSGTSLIIALVAGILSQWYLVPYFHALNLEDASLVVPLFQLIPVFSLLLGWIFLHESLTPSQLMGFGFLFTASLLLARGSTQKHQIKRKVISLMTRSSFLFAVATILFKIAVNEQSIWDTIATQSMGVGIGTLLILARPGYWNTFVHTAKKMKLQGWLALCLSETGYLASQILIMLALAVGPVSLINVLGGAQPLFLFAYGFLFTILAPKILKEDIRPHILAAKITALILIFLGLASIYL